LDDPGLRAVMRRYLSLGHSLREKIGEVLLDAASATAPWMDVEAPLRDEREDPKKLLGFPGLVPIAAAAAVAFLLGSGLMYLISESEVEQIADGTPEDSEEQSAQGFAVVGRLLAATWPAAEPGHREGDMLGAEVFRLASGMAEIQFFSGANMTVEGPAEISLTSAWEASCVEGAVRMQVPAAARGFKLQAPSSEIIDLGTEFGLVVRDGTGHVEVFDGEISIRHQGEGEKSVKRGAAFELAPDGPMTSEPAGEVEFPDVGRLGSLDQERLDAELARWHAHRDQLARDERLIAYYTFEDDGANNSIPNRAISHEPDTGGAVILAESVEGRVAGMKSALEFRRPGARVRVNLPGEFPAITFACWVRIDSLDRQYSALFMGDGYENGEPHWQIRDDGSMMLSVMVDDSRQHPKWSKSRYHHVYFSPPMWDLSMSGQWLHLASVFDPGKRAVSHFVNGERISHEEIGEDFLVDSLRIGNGEIGNWGQPFREDPSFAIRNLNGRVDEMAVFKSALDDGEIADLFERSRSDRR
ncbi:MAG: LamG-like jellyroll fold domain-containing protein, partial [Verrucomicrobiales bacterium]